MLLPSHLLLDAVNLSPQPLDHPVELHDLTLGALQVFSMHAGCGLQLTQLYPKRVTRSKGQQGLLQSPTPTLLCHKQENQNRVRACARSATGGITYSVLCVRDTSSSTVAAGIFLSIYFAPSHVLCLIKPHSSLVRKALLSLPYEWEN